MVYHVTSFNAKKANAKLIDHNFSLVNYFTLQSGTIKCNVNSGRSVVISSSLHLDPMHVTSFSGKIHYDIEDLNPQDVELSDLPDVLTDPETDISFVNPQLYIAVSNPLWESQVKARTKLEIMQIRDGEVQSVNKNGAEMTDSLYISPVEGMQNFCLTPKENFNDYISDYPNSKTQETPGLGNIIKGQGLPEGLKIDFAGACLPKQDVFDFVLGHDLDPIHGTYTLYAPLELGKGSRILYKEEATDWGLSSEDNELEISSLTLTADCVSELPVAVKLHATPLNSKGEEIKNVDMGEDVDIAAYGKDPIRIDMTGDIKDLDGMSFVITIASEKDKDAAALSPSMSLKLDNLKVKVTGAYIVKED